MLAPFGHGPWTAIAGGARAPLSFRKPNGHFHFAAPVIGTYPDLAVLHSPLGLGTPHPDPAALTGTEFAPGTRGSHLYPLGV
ncbi:MULTISPECIES: hypothetical protein [unclassified Streptomyces]|uniref:hypothetical protein n=1 Tax=Streptomyces sp. NPDC127532 TaxID=3345399 RepID=UPI00362D9D0E